MATKPEKPEVKIIRSMSDLPKPPEGERYSLCPAYTLDQARGICIRQGALKGFWFKNRVYFIATKACVQIKSICTCIEYIGDNPRCPKHGALFPRPKQSNTEAT